MQAHYEDEVTKMIQTNKATKTIESHDEDRDKTKIQTHDEVLVWSIMEKHTDRIIAAQKIDTDRIIAAHTAGVDRIVKTIEDATAKTLAEASH